MRTALLLAVAALVFSGHPAAADSLIYGCVSRGRVRIIMTSPPRCRATETPLSWNQQGPPGVQGPKGDTGLPGPPGTTVAFAHVNADGTVDEANSYNIMQSNVVQVYGGEYCFVGLPFVPHNIAVTPEFSTYAAIAMVKFSVLGDCVSVGAQFEVDIFAPGGGVTISQPFMVSVN